MQNIKMVKSIDKLILKLVSDKLISEVKKKRTMTRKMLLDIEYENISKLSPRLAKNKKEYINRISRKALDYCERNNKLSAFYPKKFLKNIDPNAQIFYLMP